jgi:hypothetical protein
VFPRVNIRVEVAKVKKVISRGAKIKKDVDVERKLNELRSLLDEERSMQTEQLLMAIEVYKNALNPEFIVESVIRRMEGIFEDEFEQDDYPPNLLDEMDEAFSVLNKLYGVWNGYLGPMDLK